MRQEAQKGNFNSYFVADKSFHHALVEAADNHLISEALKPLVDTMDQRVYREFTHQYYLKNVEDLEQVVDVHCAILEAVAKRDPKLAIEAVKDHWQKMMEIWEA
jgi:DNA-binding GntR family transcriptional regulator